MAKLTFNSAGVGVQEIDLSGPVTQAPTGVPAGVIGTATKGPAFVPVTLGVMPDFNRRFGATDGEKFGPLAVSEWLRNAGSVTYVRVLGAGRGERRRTTGNTAGSVENAGFIVGEEQPNEAGALVSNPFANENGVPGRTYFLGCYMSESLGSTIFSDAGLQGAASTLAGIAGNNEVAIPIIRGVVLAPSGVVLRLSSSNSSLTSAAPASTAIATATGGEGAITGSVVLLENGVAKSDFTMILNGHKGTDANYPNVITASFDPTAQNYFANVFNTDPLLLQEAGHMLYTHYDIAPVQAVVTGTGIISGAYGAGGSAAARAGAESIAFITTSSLGRNVGSSTIPNYESFEDRFSAPISPWIVSQKFGGSPQNLFRVESVDDGEYAAGQIKISIENIAASNDDVDLYGTFDLLVRRIDDVDEEFAPLEEFRGLSLNPASDRYIARVIGDQRIFFDFEKPIASQKLVLEGNFPNRSNWIRVIMDSKVENQESDPTALPFGVRGITHLVTSGSDPLTDITGDGAEVNESTVAGVLKHAIQPPVPFRKSLSVGVAPKNQVSPNLYWGVQFQQPTTLDDLNSGKLPNRTVNNLARFVPSMFTSIQNFAVGNNPGAADTDGNGILDADRFNRNLFTLENIQVTTASDGRADPKTAADWTYVRAGGITADPAAKTRGMNLEDLKKQSIRTFAKYSFIVQGGFDGVNIFDEDEAKITNNAVREEMDNEADRGANNGPAVRAYLKAIDIMKETSDVDIKLLAIPGLRETVITDTAALAVEDRFDAMYIMDIPERDELNAVVTSSQEQLIHVGNTVTNHINRALDTDFAAAYFPDVIVTDPTTETNVQVPPSVVVLGAMALNDSVGYPWFAPAGFTRGALASAQEAAVKLKRENLDELYAADINPIVAFANSNGPVVWGQKTLKATQSALDRVNVRRLLIEVRRQVRDIANSILFEPNREATLSRFSQAVRPRMEAIQARQGINRFKVVIDTSTTSQADIENNTIRGQIFIEPTRTAEFVSLDFVVTNQGL